MKIRPNQVKKVWKRGLRRMIQGKTGGAKRHTKTWRIGKSRPSLPVSTTAWPWCPPWPVHGGCHGHGNALFPGCFDFFVLFCLLMRSFLVLCCYFAFQEDVSSCILGRILSPFIHTYSNKNYIGRTLERLKAEEAKAAVWMRIERSSPRQLNKPCLAPLFFQISLLDLILYF